MIIGEKPPSKIIKSCDQKGVNLTKKITVYKSLSELEQVCRMPIRRKKHSSRPRKIRKKSSRRVASTPRRLVASPASSPRRLVASPRKRRRSVKKVIVKPPSFFKKVRSAVSNPVKKLFSRLSAKRSFKKPIVRREAPRRPPVVRRETPRRPPVVRREAPRRSPVVRRETPRRPPVVRPSVASARNAVPIYSPYPSYSANLKKPYDDFSNMVRGIRSPQEIMVPHEHIAYRREVFLKKIPEHLGENVAALKQRMVDMEHIHRLLEAQLMKCRKSRTPERAVNNNQLVKIEKRIGELRTEENQHNNYVQLMQEFIGKYNQSKQEEHTKIDRLRGEIHGILKKVSSAFELQGQLFDTQEKILTNITNSAQVSKTDLREWAKGIERVANEKDRLIEALVPATLRLQQVPEETNAQLKDAIRELQKIYDKQGTMFGQTNYQPQQYDARTSYDPQRSYDPRSYPQQSSELAQVLKNSERESLQKQFERLTDLVLSKQQQQAPAAIFQQQQQQQQQQQSPAVINNAGATKAELDELKTMISNLTRMVLEKPAERKSEPAKWDLPETSSANVRKMQESQRNRDDLLITGRDKGNYVNLSDRLASILLAEQKSQQMQTSPQQAMIDNFTGHTGSDFTGLLDFLAKKKLLKDLGLDVTTISNNTNTNTITGAAAQTSADDKFMQKLDEIILILKSPCKDTASPYPSTLRVDRKVIDLTEKPLAKTAEGTRIVDAIPVDDNRVVDLLGQILEKIRSGDVDSAHDHLNKLKANIGTQTHNCDDLASKLSDISNKLSSLVGGVGNITQISQQVNSMNSQTTTLTSDIKNLIIKIQTMASTGQTSSSNDIIKLNKELESKKKQLEELQNMSNPLQGQLDEYKRKFESIKQLLENIPDCDEIGIIAALTKFKQEIENLKMSKGTAEPLPEWYNNIKANVDRLFGLDLDIDGDRTKFIAYLKVIGKLLKDNHIDSPETLNDFIGEINKNKKCCEELENVKNETAKIEKEKTAEIAKLEAALKAAEKPDNNESKEEIQRLRAELLKAQEELKDLEGLAEPELERLQNELKKAQNELREQAEAAREEAEKAKKAAAEAEAAREEAEKAKKAAAEAEAARKAAEAEAARREAARREAARKAEEEAARKAAEAEAEARKAEDARREAARKAEEEAARKAAEAEARKAEDARREAARKAEAAKKADDPATKLRREFLLLIEKEKSVKYGNRLFEKNRENEITVSETNNSATKLYTIPSAIVDRVKDVAKMPVKDVNELYEIINGIGLVVVRIGGPGVTDGEKLADVENDYIKLDNCGDNQEKYGPFLAFGPNIDQKSIYENEQLRDFFDYENDIALFSYGASGSGKTYTLFGNKFIQNGKDEGIIHKIMNDKFKTSQITATAIQWYCGNIYSAYIKNNKTYKYELGNSNDTKEGVEVLNAVDKEHLNVKKYEISNSSRLLSKLNDDYFKGNYDELFTKYIHDRKDITKTKNFIKDDFVNYFFNKETKDFLDDDKRNLFGKILENLKTFDVSRNDKSFASFNNKKQPMNVGDKLLDGHLIKSEDNPFDDTFAVQMPIEDADGLNNYLTQVMKSRPTRATAKNPDSSRSHLFIRFRVTNKTNNKTQNIYTCDLGGIEEPLEYFDLAMLEGYWVVLGIKQIGEIIESYNNYKLPKEDVILGDLKRYLYPTRVIPSSDSTELLFDLQNIRLDNKTIIKNIYFNKLFQLMKYVIGEEKLTNFLKKKDTSALTKIVSFVNVKKQIKKDIDDLARNNACTAAKDSLLFAEKLLKISRDKPNNFGRIARRRSYARKGAARLANEGHKQAKRRSFKRSKRPSVGVATSATNKARKRSYRRTSVGRAVATSQESGLSKLRRRSIRRVRTTLLATPTKSLRRKRS